MKDLDFKTINHKYYVSKKDFDKDMVCVKNENYIGFVLKESNVIKLTDYALNQMYELLDDRIIDLMSKNSGIVMWSNYHYNSDECEKLSQSFWDIFQEHINYHTIDREKYLNDSLDIDLLAIIEDDSLMKETIVILDWIEYDHRETNKNNEKKKLFIRNSGYNITWINIKYLPFIIFHCDPISDEYLVYVDKKKYLMYHLEMRIKNKVFDMEKCILDTYQKYNIDKDDVFQLQQNIREILHEISLIHTMSHK